MPLVLDGTNGVSGVDGTASNPAIEGTDSNTGIFYPAADTVAIGTGGTERLRVDSAGNSGFGVTPPATFSGYTALNLSATSIYNFSASGNRQTHIYNNGFINSSGNAAYINTDAASRIYMTNGTIQFGVAGSGSANANITFTQAMTLDATGQIGIGATSPAASLDIARDSETQIIINRTTTTTGASFIKVTNAGGNAYIGRDSSAGNRGFATGGAAYGLVITNESNHPICFGTNNTERARITSGGALWVGNTTRQSTDNHTFIQSVTAGDWTANFQCNTTTAANNLGILVNYNGSAPNGTGSPFLRCNDTANTRAEIRSNGGIANYTANNSPLSDRRLKTDIQPAGSYLEKICAIPVVTYLYKDQTDDLLNLGVIAQDVQTAAPELCNEEGWGTKAEDGTNYLGIWETDLHYAVMKAVQELKNIVDTQATRIEALEAEVQALKGNA